MSQRSSVSARTLAVAALVAGFLALVVVVAGSVGGGDDGDRARSDRSGQKQPKKARKDSAPSAYVVQNGDTLTSIASKTGVPISRLQDLNPGVDPQILVSGEKLKLR